MEENEKEINEEEINKINNDINDETVKLKDDPQYKFFFISF